MAGKYRAYPEYKESGVEWLGETPEHWFPTRLKFESSINMGQSPNSDDCNQDGDGLPFLQGNAEFGVKSPSPKQYCDIPRKVANKGDLLFSVRAPVGALNAADQQYGIGRGLCAIASYDMLASDFLWWLIPVIKSELNSVSTGSTFEAVSVEQVENVVFFRPSLNEQQQIANFLDHETAKIDTLIEKQQLLIKLLKEKRQAVISHAVTKGLNPNAPLRDSGVEWLGEVPGHWVVAQLKFNTVDMQTGPFGSQLHAEDYIEDGIPLVNPAHMADGKIIPDSKVSVDEATWHRLKRHQLFQGDLIFARRGELGRCAVVTKEQEGWLCGTGSLKAKLNSRLTPEYSYLLITSNGVVSELSLESKGSTMDNLNTETLGRVRLPVPPVDEQKKILDYVNAVSGKFRNLINKACLAIELMQERRTALISAAVTGKIDVRNFKETGV
ncbi:MAG: restriction endonuclease subunit S [Methylovulum sp.]|nr:restriction endonuclease subunit S [Methylovulum sp.]